jgi:hypothetical protein
MANQATMTAATSAIPRKKRTILNKLEFNSRAQIGGWMASSKH